MNQMLQPVVISCDRCGEIIEGYKSLNGTSGFYDVSNNNFWAQYANESEESVCDDCMWKSEKYIKDYPWMAAKQ